MMKKLLLLTLLAFTLNLANAQFPAFKQYFDGADTLASNSILIEIDTLSTNIWQIGPPQKNVFDSAATLPNALVTDTINTYPVNLNSSFEFGINYRQFNVGILAVRWKQQLDFDSLADGGIVEYTTDSGANWINVFNSPDVYNFYGFDTANTGIITASGKMGFTGTDTSWRDIWLCFQGSFIRSHPMLRLRFTAVSDTVDKSKDGWMIDNMLTEETYYHTVNSIDPNRQLLVYPTITTGIIKVEASGDVKLINNIVIVDAQGRVLKRFEEHNTKAVINLADLPAGNYFLNVHTDRKIEVHKVMLTH